MNQNYEGMNMKYTVEKEVLEDGCGLLSMYDDNGSPVCHFCTKVKTLTTAYQPTVDCVVSLCKDCSDELGPVEPESK